MINYELTQHARDVLAKRKIKITWLEQVLTFPQRVDTDATDPMLEHRIAEISECYNKFPYKPHTGGDTVF